eukprot:Opistho-2@34328
MVYETRRKPTSTSRGGKKPSGSLYVGYVEDEESIESIMKKFEELQRLQAETKLVEDEPPRNKGKGKYVDPETTLSDAQLEELFKRTSSFTVRSVSDYGAALNLLESEMDIDAVDGHTLAMLMDESDDSDDDDYNEDYYGEADEDFFDSEFGSSGRGHKRRRSSGAKAPRMPKEKRPRYDREAILQKYRNLHLQDAEGRQIIVKKKIRQTDPRLPAYTRIPSLPIPKSWASTIITIAAMKKRPEIPLGSKYIEAPLLTADLPSLCGGGYQAILMDPPIVLPGQEKLPGMIDVGDLEKLKIDDALIPAGFIFVWIDKLFFPDLVRILGTWSFTYVENICWVRLLANNKYAHEDADYFRRSKLSCFIFRKYNTSGDGNNEQIELRHQRNPDAVFDFIKPRESLLDKEGLYQPEEKPQFVYDVVETLLPDAVYKRATDTQKERPGRILELWGQRDRRREGWVSLVNSRESPSTQA